MSSHCSINSKGKRKGKKQPFSEHLLHASLVLGNEEICRPQTVQEGLINNSVVRVGKVST